MALNFDCDRPAKNDFTASTQTYWAKYGQGDKISFWEMTSACTMVPFGSELASPRSRFDVFINYDDRIWYAVELKERNHPSDYERTINEGAFMNDEKKALVPQLKEQGYIPLWAELYTDGKIRLWNLDKINLDTLEKKTFGIKKINIDPNSPKITQTRYLLPVSAATLINRIKSIQNDGQGNDN